MTPRPRRVYADFPDTLPLDGTPIYPGWSGSQNTDFALRILPVELTLFGGWRIEMLYPGYVSSRPDMAWCDVSGVDPLLTRETVVRRLFALLGGTYNERHGAVGCRVQNRVRPWKSVGFRLFPDGHWERELLCCQCGMLLHERRHARFADLSIYCVRCCPHRVAAVSP